MARSQGNRGVQDQDKRRDTGGRSPHQSSTTPGRQSSSGTQPNRGSNQGNESSQSKRGSDKSNPGNLKKGKQG